MLDISVTQEKFINEKVREKFQSLGIMSKNEDVEKISKAVLKDEQFWNLFNSLFETYIVTHVLTNQHMYFPLKEVL